MYSIWHSFSCKPNALPISPVAGHAAESSSNVVLVIVNSDSFSSVYMIRQSLQRCNAALPTSSPSSVRLNSRVRSSHIGRSYSTYRVGTENPRNTSDHGAWNIDDEVDRLLRNRTLRASAKSVGPTRSCSYRQYQNKGGTVLDHVLPYEAYPSTDRRAGSSGREVMLVVHVAEDDQAGAKDHVISSGFVVEGQVPGSDQVDRFVVSCAHTLEQVSEQLEEVHRGRPR